MMKRISRLLLLFVVISADPAQAQQRQHGKYPAQVKVLSTFQKGNIIWKNVLIPRRLSQGELIRLARLLHKADPTVFFRLFNDERQFDAFKRWEENYPSSSHPFPTEWAKRHHVASIRRTIYERGEWCWVLLKMYSMEKIADLGCEMNQN